MFVSSVFDVSDAVSQNFIWVCPRALPQRLYIWLDSLCFVHAPAANVTSEAAAKAVSRGGVDVLCASLILWPRQVLPPSRRQPTIPPSPLLAARPVLQEEPWPRVPTRAVQDLWRKVCVVPPPPIMLRLLERTGLQPARWRSMHHIRLQGSFPGYLTTTLISARPLPLRPSMLQALL